MKTVRHVLRDKVLKDFCNNLAASTFPGVFTYTPTSPLKADAGPEPGDEVGCRLG